MKKLFKNSNKCSSGEGIELTKTSIKNGDNKRKKIIIISLIVILLTLTIGISFAVWNYSFVGSANTIDTGEVSLELLESNTDIISIENALPISDETGKTLNETFDFAVTTKASKDLDIGYSIYLEKIYTKCSDLTNPTKESYPSCYFTVSDTDRDKLISWLANDDGFGYGVTIEKATEFYNAIITHNKEEIYNFHISAGWSEEDAQYEADWWEEVGYEVGLINRYNYNVETITYETSFNGDNMPNPSQYLQDNQVKIYLEDYEGNVLIAPTKVSELGENYILYNDINKHSKTNTKQTDKFKLRVWVDKDVETGSWDENTKQEYKFKIGVKSPQEETNTTMMTGDSFNNLIIDNYGSANIKTVEFRTNQSVIDTSNAVDGIVLDVSKSQDGSIVAWAEGTSPNYTLYIATTKYIIYANPDSSWMFASFTELTTINANALDVSKVKNMSSMFNRTRSLTNLDLSTWDTSKVTNSGYMFCETRLTSDTLITGPKWTLNDETIFSCPGPS